MTFADSLPAGIQGTLLDVLDAAMEIFDADFGNIQLLGKDQRLRLVAQRGFPDWWIQHWDNGAPQAHGVSAATLRSERRIFVEDVQQSQMFSAYADVEAMTRIGLHTLDDLTHPDDRAVGWRSWERVLRSGTGDHREVRIKRYLRKSGEPVWVERDISFVPDAQGGERYLVSATRPRRSACSRR